ncbi:MAG TPA: toprim domain-containing protein, partial [bacterium]|nr:toprim domain-containing protein [bacterium]
APDAWDRLLNAAKKEGLRPSSLERAGLAIARDSKTGHYDRFRGRLMFPIETAASKVIGFGGRILGEGEPKYLNSPETPLFQKRRTLYGFPQARDGLRDTGEAMLVEGYTDVLALAQAGFRNALASLGTAFTEEHAKAIKRSVDRVIVVFDGDEAGRKAAVMSAGPLLGAGLDVKMVMLPAGQDPDSLIRSQGKDAFREELERARPALDVLLGEELYEGGAPRERAIRRALEALAGVEDPLRRRLYLEDLALRASLPAAMLGAQLKAMRTKDAQPRGRGPAPEPGPPPAARVVQPLAETKRPPALERTFVAVVLHDPEVGAHLLGAFGPDRFEHPVTARIIAKAGELAAAAALTSDALLGAFQDDANAYELLGELSVSPEFESGIERRAEDCSNGMERRSMEREMAEVMQEMRKAKAQGDEARMREFVRRRGELARGIEALRAPRNPIER